MLAPAHVGHLAMLRNLIRDASAEGSIDRGSCRRHAASGGVLREPQACARPRLLRRRGSAERTRRIGRGARLRLLARRPAQRQSARGLRTVSRARTAATSCGSPGSSSAAAAEAQGRALIDALFATSARQEDLGRAHPPRIALSRGGCPPARGASSSNRSAIPRHCAGFCAGARRPRWRRESAAAVESTPRSGT